MNGVGPLQRGVRDLACTARAMPLVLEHLAKHPGVATSVGVVAETLRLESDDVLRWLYALEHLGLVEPTHYRITSTGTQTMKE